MKKITVSAPGKLMLLGEHAVVYGRPCIVTAVDQRMKLTAEKLDTPQFILNAPDVGIKNYKKPISQLGKGKIPKEAKFSEAAACNFLISHPELGSGSKKMPKQVRHDRFGVKITIKSDFSPKFGFGTSSAVTVCTIFALSKLFNIKLKNKQLFDLSYKTVLDVQGKGSGFDVAAAIYGGTLYFVTGGRVIKPLKISSLPLIVGYSGIKADTVKILDSVAKRAKKNPKIIESIYAQIETLVKAAKVAIEKSDRQTLGELMDTNQGYLETLGVSSSKLSAMVSAARQAGAYGAKLSGAGIGDCMIALGSSSKIKTAIEKVGGEVINVKTNAQGVRMEK